MQHDQRIGDTLKEVLRELKISQTTVASWLGISQAAVSRRLDGEVEFRESELHTVANELGFEFSLNLVPGGPNEIVKAS